MGQACDILTRAIQDGRLPPLDEVPWAVLETSAITLSLGLFLISLLLPSIRRLLWNVTDTTLAVICLMLLLVVVIGMPFGAMYIGSRGVGFLGSALAHAFPQLGSLVDTISSLLGFRE